MVGHLFLGCVFSRQVWFALLQPLHLETLMPEREENVAYWWLRQRLRINAGERVLFESASVGGLVALARKEQQSFWKAGGECVGRGARGYPGGGGVGGRRVRPASGPC